MYQARLQRELKELAAMPNDEKRLVALAPVDGQHLEWQCSLFGLPASLSPKGSLDIRMKLTPQYPFQPPRLEIIESSSSSSSSSLMSNLFSPTHGSLRAEVIDKLWSPTVTLKQYLLEVRTVLLQQHRSS